MKYLFRVMMPGRTEDVLDDFMSDTPFGHVSAGDLLDCEQYRRAQGHGAPLLRVIRVEHKLFQSENSSARHLIRVFTEEVPDSPESRLAREV